MPKVYMEIGQNYRETTLKRFRTKKINILVAKPDVAARGIDNDLSRN